MRKVVNMNREGDDCDDHRVGAAALDNIDDKMEVCDQVASEAERIAAESRKRLEEADKLRRARVERQIMMQQ